jgi:hypothetical protein
MNSDIHVNQVVVNSVSDFSNTISALMADISLSLEQSKKVTTDVDEFKSRSAFVRVFGTVTGKNDEDLAIMISSLGSSLGTTQKVLDMLLKIQSEKNRALTGFHRALVDKIDDLKSNDNVLDLGMRENAILVFEHLKQQVEDKLEQARVVEENVQRLDEQSKILIHINQRIDNYKNDQVLLADQFHVNEKLISQLEKKGNATEQTLLSLNHQAAVCSQNISKLRGSYDEYRFEQENNLKVLEGKVDRLSQIMRKKQFDFRDLLLFITSSAVLVLVYLYVFN